MQKHCLDDFMLVTNAADYLRDTLGIDIKPKRWQGEKSLPPFLQERFGFFEARILELPCLLAVDADPTDMTPAQVRKQLDLIHGTSWKGAVVYVAPRLSSWNRRRLVEQRLAFIIPGNQLYLPPLGLDLHEYFRQGRVKKETLSPSTQLLLLWALTCKKREVHPVGRVAEVLGYAAMTIRRAFDELEAIGVARTTTLVRETGLELNAPSLEVWEKAQPHLRNPVQRVHPVRQLDEGLAFAAGETALAAYSMIGAPASPVVAMSRASFRVHVEEGSVVLADDKSEAVAGVQVWSYAPAILAKDGVVDLLSLYLSLAEEEDPRVEIARAELLRSVKWSLGSKPSGSTSVPSRITMY